LSWISPARSPETRRLRPRLRARQKHRLTLGRKRQLALLQRAETVAQPGGALELEFLGGFTHLGLESGDGLAQLGGGGDVFRYRIVYGHGDVIASTIPAGAYPPA